MINTLSAEADGGFDIGAGLQLPDAEILRSGKVPVASYWSRRSTRRSAKPSLAGCGNSLSTGRLLG